LSDSVSGTCRSRSRSEGGGRVVPSCDARTQTLKRTRHWKTKGSCFTVRIPQSAAQSAAQSASVKHHRPGFSVVFAYLRRRTSSGKIRPGDRPDGLGPGPSSGIWGLGAIQKTPKVVSAPLTAFGILAECKMAELHSALAADTCLRLSKKLSSHMSTSRNQVLDSTT